MRACLFALPLMLAAAPALGRAAGSAADPA